MSDPKPQDSKCWDCKHGLCTEQIYYQPTVDQPQGREDDFRGNESWSDDQPDSKEMEFLEMRNITAFCYYTDQLKPIQVGIVSDCNRYVPIDTKNTASE